MQRNPRTYARRQAMKQSLATPLACWTCGQRLHALAGGLDCPNGHPVPDLGDDVHDLWPLDREPPRVDTYSTPFGWAYDTGVNSRGLARLAARLEWGTDVGRMYRMMDEGLRVDRGLVVLDVPVGGGTTFAEGAPELHGLLVGVDLSPGMLARAARRRRARGLEGRVLLVRGDATRLPLAAASVETVLCFNGLHVIPDKEAAMVEFARVLKPGGRLLGTVLVAGGPAPFNAIVGLERLASFFVPTTFRELRSLAKRAGFSRWDQDQEGALLYFRGELT